MFPKMKKGKPPKHPPTEKRVSLISIDDHPIVWRGLRELVAEHPPFQLVGEAPTGQMGIDLANKLRPDLVIMDIQLPDMSGLEAARQILAQRPRTRIVVFAADAAQPLVDEALKAEIGRAHV